MVEEKPKILVLADGNYPKEVDSVDYKKAKAGYLPNIAEYDVVIIDLTNLDSTKTDIVLKSPQLKIKCFHNLLWAGHELVLILNKRHQEIAKYKGQITIDILYNLPIQVKITEEIGNTVIVEDASYEKYYCNHVGDSWDYYIIPSEENLYMPTMAMKELFSLKECKSYFIECGLEKIIAKNGFERPVSFSAFYKLRDSYYLDIMIKKSGLITFLQPPNKSKSIESAIKTLLEGYGVYIETQAPTWVAEFKVPNEEAKDKEIDTLEKEKIKIEENIKNMKKERKDMIRFKNLLYETGDILRNTVWETLNEIGFKVNKYDEKKEDGSIEDNSTHVVLETKGYEKSAVTDDVRQLDDWISDYTKRKGVEPRGLLIVNHYRLENPLKRNEPFPPDLIRYINARSTKISLMTTYQLFKIYCDVKNKKLDPANIRKKILENEGVFKL